jgi:hypothetical protein
MTPQIPEYLQEADRYWLPHRFRRLAWLRFSSFPLTAHLRSTGEPVTILAWRRAWFGIAFTLQFADDRIEHGYDPSTVQIP